MLNHNSFYYILFLIISLLTFWFATFKSDEVIKKKLLIIISFAFYCTFSWKTAVFLLFVSVLNYLFIQKLHSQKHRFYFLSCSALINLSPIILVKLQNDYSFNYFFSLTTIGISFYVFKSLSLSFDIYYKEIEELPSRTDYYFFLFFFPTILCGPIDRFTRMASSYKQPESPFVLILKCLPLFLRGFCKKVLFSDILKSALSNSLIDQMDDSFFKFVIILISNIIYITADFSGYSDMAKASAKMFGFEIADNFSLSLFKRDLYSFWQNHHISLSEWIRDYIYLPVILNFRNKVPTLLLVLLATLSSFVISGLWHSITTKGIYFGLIQALGVTMTSFIKQKAHWIFSTFILWLTNMLSFGILFFNPDEFKMRAISNLYSPIASLSNSLTVLIIFSVLYMSFDYFSHTYEKRINLKYPVALGAFYSLLVLIAIITSKKSIDFVYFNF
jgi:alginate O-acetyltransferase complex protein AlgI